MKIGDKVVARTAHYFAHSEYAAVNGSVGTVVEESCGLFPGYVYVSFPETGRKKARRLFMDKCNLEKKEDF